ncbi:hypothetical protein [Streptomyces sp. NPDC056549]|uniref:hypothetical protein n=1 Tax=Streptomyces sp. NPDC056549 TaxID=3345864 RepID=UPI0036BD3612
MSACTCRHCGLATQADTVAPVAYEPVLLPTEPRPFRVHYPEGHTQDCVLHPNGRLTTVMTGEAWVSALSFDEMRASSWEHAHIEWDPAPLPEAESTFAPAALAVQDALIPAA